MQVGQGAGVCWVMNTGMNTGGFSLAASASPTSIGPLRSEREMVSEICKCSACVRLAPHSCDEMGL